MKCYILQFACIVFNTNENRTEVRKVGSYSVLSPKFKVDREWCLRMYADDYFLSHE